MGRSKHIPIRSCVGCRKKKRKEELIRLKKGKEGTVLVDWMKNLGGRGFYLCPEETCFKKAQKKKWIASWEIIQNRFPSMEAPLQKGNVDQEEDR